ncbi:MAG: S-layer homology domain-containing protein [Clostridiaceae bacterium]
MKRLFCVMTIIALITALIPLDIFAGSPVTLNAIPGKYRGDSVTISGMTVLEEITVKVLRPNNTVLYVNVLKGGGFCDTFTLPADTALGAYTVIAGKGQEAAAITFSVIDRGGEDEDDEDESSSDQADQPDVGEPEVKITDDGMPRVVTEPSFDKGSGTAASAVSAKLIEKALGQAKETSEGIRTVVLEIPEVKDAGRYSLQLPANVLSSGDENLRIKIETPLGSIAAPGNMFSGSDLVKGEDIKLTIGLADKTGIAEDIRRQIGDRPVIDLNVKAGERTVNWNNPDAPVTVSIPYAPTAEELKDPEHITVWYIDGQGNATPVPNGRYDAASGKVIFTITHMSKYAITFVKKTFADIQNCSWSKKEIEVLASKGIIEGTSATSYSPKSNITRADFITLLMRALELKTSFTANFDDVKASDYYYNAAGMAKKLGIAAGVGNNKFNPEACITREDMMVMAARAMEKAGKLRIDADISVLSAYADSASISHYAEASASALVKSGIITGDGKRINPKGNTTREEIAVVIYRIYNK